jgi:hypothetical protein
MGARSAQCTMTSCGPPAPAGLLATLATLATPEAGSLLLCTLTLDPDLDLDLDLDLARRLHASPRTAPGPRLDWQRPRTLVAVASTAAMQEHAQYQRLVLVAGSPSSLGLRHSQQPVRARQTTGATTARPPALAQPRDTPAVARPRLVVVVLGRRRPLTDGCGLRNLGKLAVRTWTTRQRATERPTRDFPTLPNGPSLQSVWLVRCPGPVIGTAGWAPLDAPSLRNGLLLHRNSVASTQQPLCPSRQ